MRGLLVICLAGACAAGAAAAEPARSPLVADQAKGAPSDILMSRHTVAYSFGAFDLKGASAAVSITAPAAGPRADGACPDIHNEGPPPRPNFIPIRLRGSSERSTSDLDVR